MSFVQLFNLFEGLLWVGIAVVLLLRREKAGANADLALVAALVFIVFGISDFIEIFTGAWYRPIWLLAVKAGCVAVLAACLGLYWRRRRRPN